MAAPGILRFLKPIRLPSADTASSVPAQVVVRVRNQTTVTRNTNTTIKRPAQ